MIYKPQKIARKLRLIRARLGVSQTGMLRLLKINCCYGRISEYERGKRQPTILTLLAYARAAKVPLEEIVDDELELSI
ncbi:MAG TPA: helix-turn-helix transcriptional regulator [Pyrinomonadaceae bacterium]|nr:helix-turn-helix transcriptional regulator [Pyrinomonadaceae bacterium]